MPININSIKKSLIIATALTYTLFSGSVVAQETGLRGCGIRE